ncbi:MAG: polysaccharide deacetylase family protein [Sphingobacteriales bacterium]|nr:polysaccharide deacetylase family protein [Sphingobacteriales bacterium]
MPILLDIYEKYNIKSTFFFTGYIAKLIPDIVKMILGKGHEVASHGLSHKVENGFDIMPFNKQKEHLLTSKNILEDISGEEVISFRAPALRMNEFTSKALIETDYKIDSSVASQRFDMFMSFGGLKKLNWLTAPRLPYRTSEKSIFKKGNANLIEVPLSATIFPYIGTTMRIFPLLTRCQHHLLNFESKINKKPIVFDIHPNEFIDESSEKREITRRSKNSITFILKDLVRSKLKIKNLGKDAIPLYEKEIEYFLTKDYKFLTIKDYCIQTGLLKF